MELLAEDILVGAPLKWAWKPLLQRYLTAGWSFPKMRPGERVFPAELKRWGLYLHVPFCRRPCTYCPYNRVTFDESLYRRYETAAHREIDLIAQRLAEVRGPCPAAASPVTSLYAGGGTPTIVPEGLARLLTHIKAAFGRAGDVGVELHPGAMDEGCLDVLKGLGVSMVSVGVESLSDRLLRLIGRAHDAATAERSLRRALARRFDTVSADLMFALPTQTLDELDEDLQRALSLGVDQISCYPIFGFPYTELGKRLGIKQIRRPASSLLRRMLDLIRRRADDFGLVQGAVWSFHRPRGKKFTSTTRHHYLGIGPSAASMVPGQFSVNTFSIPDYAAALPGRLPTALVLPVSRQLEMAYWLYWRAYEMTIPRRDFAERFGKEIETVYGKLLTLLTRTGMARLEDGAYQLTERSGYLIHRFQNEYALNSINRLWGQCRQEAWPTKVGI
ncbi:MAG: radical SAM protein [Pirellulales bacterium]|nr:radical SAM protein [Pirellulales bacterium]